MPFLLATLQAQAAAAHDAQNAKRMGFLLCLIYSDSIMIGQHGCGGHPWGLAWQMASPSVACGASTLQRMHHHGMRMESDPSVTRRTFSCSQE